MWRCGSGSFRGEDRSVFRLDPRMMLQRKEAGFKSDFKVSRWKHHGVWSAELGRRRRNYGGLQRWYLCFHWWHVVFLTSFSCHSLENFTASLTSRCLHLFINLSVPWGELKKNIKKVWFWALFGGNRWIFHLNRTLLTDGKTWEVLLPYSIKVNGSIPSGICWYFHWKEFACSPEWTWGFSMFSVSEC